MRTGNEPATARSALRMRFWLSVWGLIWTAFGTTAFAMVGRTGWSVVCGVLFLIVVVDLVMVLRHIRQGPHFQPGREVPPYDPVPGPGADAGRPDEGGDPEHYWQHGGGRGPRRDPAHHR
ncbi:DUF6343 family protein [Streptomyces sp. NPDC051569]|uniref:DUF6343 family protein n=1 Tax=Streptomyces sp. NPDC051569 TaxID=3365661 RepID=UPI003796D05B